RLELPQRLCTLQIDIVEVQSTAQHMCVDVVEARDDGSAARVHDLRVRTFQPADLFVASHRDDVIAADGDRLLEGLAVAWIDLAVHYEQIRRRGRIRLRDGNRADRDHPTDDQGADDRPADAFAFHAQLAFVG